MNTQSHHTITQADIEAWQTEQFYLDQPIKEISKERWWEMLEILPPLDWHSSGGIERFSMVEFMTGNVTSHFMHYHGCYFECYVRHRDKTTYPQITQLERVKSTPLPHEK